MYFSFVCPDQYEHTNKVALRKFSCFGSQFLGKDWKCFGGKSFSRTDSLRCAPGSNALGPLDIWFFFLLFFLGLNSWMGGHSSAGRASASQADASIYVYL